MEPPSKMFLACSLVFQWAIFLPDGIKVTTKMLLAIRKSLIGFSAPFHIRVIPFNARIVKKTPTASELRDDCARSDPHPYCESRSEMTHQ